MVLGTTSGAGKSWLTTALCRWYANQGLKVAPFKAQNMSNNARVVPTLDGKMGEMGSAQYFQALAARAVPDVRMNPVLLKPEADTRSQVVLMGQVDADLTRAPWRERSERVWPVVAAALDSLRDEFDVVVIEGAGSPAEINLYDSDIVNMRVARCAQACCWLVSDIDRGGAFAHLYGTWALLPDADRALIQGFVLNKFRGDAMLLAPAPEMLEALTGVPTIATIPMVRHHGLPEEDGVFDDSERSTGLVRLTIAIVAYPRISNLDEFQPLLSMSGVRVRWVREPAGLLGADWVILPGSKATIADLAWLRVQKLDAAVAQHAAAGGAVLGICGGLQMLGEAIVDPLGVEGGAGEGNAPGLGLLPLVTAFAAEKTVRHATHRFATDWDNRASAPWQALADVSVQGYEIHHGHTALHPAMLAIGVNASPVLGTDEAAVGWVSGDGLILGVYLHGLFEDTRILSALFSDYSPIVTSLDQRLDVLAQHIEQAFDRRWLSCVMPR